MMRHYPQTFLGGGSWSVTVSFSCNRGLGRGRSCLWRGRMPVLAPAAAIPENFRKLPGGNFFLIHILSSIWIIEYRLEFINRFKSFSAWHLLSRNTCLSDILNNWAHETVSPIRSQTSSAGETFLDLRPTERVSVLQPHRLLAWAAYGCQRGIRNSASGAIIINQ